MSSATPVASSGAVSIVPERRFVVHVTFGLMALIFAGALGFGAFIEDPISRWAIQSVAGLLLAAILVAWVHTMRNPARLEITPGSITLARGARPNLRRLQRVTGVLHLVSAGWRSGQTWLTQQGSDERLLIGAFDARAVRAAAIAQGWTWAD